VTDRSLTIAAWVAMAAVMLALEVAARMSSGRIPTATRVISVALHPVAGRLAIGLAWMWLGWHVFAR
jgi:hypothetical protein